MQKDYNIGLDIGTASVGYAVIDDNFNIIKKGNKRKALWGARLFDMATTAVERRNFRSTRRRYDRRRERIRLLQDEFREEINKVDPTFFQKLKTSNISPDDIKNKKIPLTNYDKKEIFSNLKREVIFQNKRMISCVDNKYPTIYHLRKKLIINKEKEDIRLIYLAIHHIIKYRGNFNYNMDEFNINKINVQEKLEEVLNTIFEICTDIYNQEPSIDNINLKELENVFYIPNKNDKKRAITKELTTQFHNKVSKEMASLLAGSSANLENLFAKNIENVKKIDFTDINIDKEIDKLQSELPEEFEIINAFKELYDMISLKQLFKDQNSASISNLMVANYDKHNKDLHLIKDLIHPYQSDFKKLFKDKIKDKKEELSVYTKYIRNKLTYNEFTNEIKKVLEKITAKENQEQIKKILESIENGSENMTSNAKSELNNTSNNTTNNTTENTNRNSYSDVPQNQIQDVENGTYLTDYRKIVENNKNNVTSNDNSNSIGTNENTSNTNRQNNNNLTEKTIRTPSDKLNLYLQMQDNIKNIYTLIYNDLSSLFYGLVN